MYDDNWELIRGEDAHRIEVLNHLSQVNQIEAMVIYSLHHHGSPEGSSQYLNEAALRELHRTGTFLLLREPGEYRKEYVDLQLMDGTVVYVPPPHEEVGARLDEFFKQLGQRWWTYKPVEAAAFTLWFLNWVHPFKNGNGRTARAFCYATMALRMGYVPPGEITVPELIKRDDEDYQNGLRVADASYQETGEPDLSPLESLIDRLLAEQLELALAAAGEI